MQAFSPFVSIVLAFVLAPILAILTKGKYYIARERNQPSAALNPVGTTMKPTPVTNTEVCSVCGYEYEMEDILDCPFHEAPICSLCCSLDKVCHDACKTEVS